MQADSVRSVFLIFGQRNLADLRLLPSRPTSSKSQPPWTASAMVGEGALVAAEHRKQAWD
jgi:hypothetical protein